jgi:hypothetical protein
MIFVAVDSPMEISPGLLSGRAVVSRGDRLTLWLVYTEEAPGVYPQLFEAEEAIAETQAYWTGWSRSCRYEGLAGPGHPKRDYAEAAQLCAIRRHCRRADNLPA